MSCGAARHDRTHARVSGDCVPTLRRDRLAGVIGDYYTLSEAAAVLGIDRRTLQRRITRGELVTERQHGLTLIHRDALAGQRERRKPGRKPSSEVKRAYLAAQPGSSAAPPQTPEGQM